jgi:hypothetical protein
MATAAIMIKLVNSRQLSPRPRHHLQDLLLASLAFFAIFSRNRSGDLSRGRTRSPTTATRERSEIKRPGEPSSAGLAALACTLKPHLLLSLIVEAIHESPVGLEELVRCHARRSRAIRGDRLVAAQSEKKEILYSKVLPVKRKSEATGDLGLGVSEWKALWAV